MRWSRKAGGAPDPRDMAVDAHVQHLVATRDAEEAAGQVRGRHYVEWVPTLDQMRTERRDDEALSLLHDILDATERAARVTGLEPASGYYKRAATIYRRRKQYAEEVQVLERFQSACPGGRGSREIDERLSRARDLLLGG